MGMHSESATLRLSPQASALVAARLGLATVPPPPVVAPVALVEPKPRRAKKSANYRARLRAEAAAIRAELADAFPDVITALGYSPRVLLKIGIDQDIRALLPERRPAAVSRFMWSYTNEPAYQRQLKIGARAR
jgi:hypothetical protein